MGKLDFQHCFFLMHTRVYDADLSRDVIEQLCAEEENGVRKSFSRYLLWEISVLHLWTNQQLCCTVQGRRVPLSLISKNGKIILHVNLSAISISISFCRRNKQRVKHTCPASIRPSIAHPVFTICGLFPSRFVYTYLITKYCVIL